MCRLFTIYNVDMEVHADINTNPNFKSNDALKEAMGIFMGMGFVFKAKPHAFASLNPVLNKVVQPFQHLKNSSEMTRRQATMTAGSR